MLLDHWALLVLFIGTPRHKRHKSNYSVEIGSDRLEMRMDSVTNGGRRFTFLQKQGAGKREGERSERASGEP